MKVLLIRSRATDPGIRKIARSLSGGGYEVELLVWDREPPPQPVKEPPAGVHTFRFRAPSDTLGVLIYFPVWWLYELFFLLRHRYDIIHAADLDTLYPAILAKLLRGARLNYTIYDFYAHHLPEGALPWVRQLIRTLVGSAERFGLRFTETVFLVDEARAGDVEGAKYRDLVYIYNTPPDAAGDSSARGLSHGGKQLIIFYGGILHRSRGLGILLGAIQGLSDVKLIVAGSGPDRGIIEEAASGPGSMISFLGWIPHDEIIRHTLESDLLVALYDPSIPVNRFASPNKLFEAMMCGKPIIVNEGSSLAAKVRNEGCGMVIPFHDPAALRHAVVTLRDDPSLRSTLGKNARRAYETKYSWEIMEKRLLFAYGKPGEGSR